MKKLPLIMLVLLTISLIACSSDSNDESPIPTPNPSAKVTYNGNIKAIINGNCANCHGSTPANGAPSSASFDAYTKVKAVADKIITRTNDTSSPMPTSGLMSQTNRNLIKKWKADGLLEN